MCIEDDACKSRACDVTRHHDLVAFRVYRRVKLSGQGRQHRLFSHHPLSRHAELSVMVAPWGNTDILKTSVQDKYIAFENAIYAAVGDENGMVVDWPGLQMQMVCPTVVIFLKKLTFIG